MPGLCNFCPTLQPRLLETPLCYSLFSSEVCCFLSGQKCPGVDVRVSALPLWPLSTYAPSLIPGAWDSAKNKIRQSSLSFRHSMFYWGDKQLVNYIKIWEMIKALGKTKQERSGRMQYFACKDRK